MKYALCQHMAYPAILSAIIARTRRSTLSLSGSKSYYHVSSRYLLAESIQDSVSRKEARNRPAETLRGGQDTLGRRGESW